jgi:integrase
VLSKDELSAILAALGSDPFSEIIRLLMLTGQRRSEIGGLRWSEVDFSRDLIVLPPERCKNGRQHEVPLSTQARAILERQPRRNEWVWGCEWNSWSEPKAKLDRRLNGMAPWTIHDCRRSAATHLGELGVLPHVIEQILNHQSGHRAGVAGIYQRSKYQDQVRAALQTWGTYVERLNPAD